MTFRRSLIGSLLTVSAIVILSPPSAAAGPVDATALRPHLVAGDVASAVGYTPALVDGFLIAPHGSCSSPVPLPAEFETPCAAHDLGYDILRAADRAGAPLPASARRSMDDALFTRMDAACDHRTATSGRFRCRVMASAARSAVTGNSMRQSYGPPVVEDPARLLAAAAAAVGAAVLVIRGRRS